MYAKIKIDGLSEAEKAAREILEHIDAIKQAELRLGISSISIEVDLKEDAASGN